MHKRGPAKICEPPPNAWRGMFEENQSALGNISSELQELRREFRSEMLAAASDYESEILHLAARIGVKLRSINLHPDPAGIIMAGHQPVIYHPGLMAKIDTLESCSNELNCQGINISIDTDSGFGAEWTYPISEGGIAHAQLATASSLFLNQTVRPVSDLDTIVREIVNQHILLGQTAIAERARHAGELLKLLPGESVAAVNTLLRRVTVPKHRFLELPLSRLVQLPSAASFLSSIVADADKFCRSYNNQLDQHRTDHQIKNLANPFPNLTYSDDRFELPFWRIDITADKRIPVFASGNQISLGRDEFIAPRGALITTMLRLLGADLFIHGMGGARYEAITDGLLKTYFNLSQSNFIVASANCYLFEDEIVRYEQALATEESFRRLPSRIPDFLGRGLFSSSEEDALLELHSKRAILLSELQAKKESKLDARSAGEALKRIDQEIKDLLWQTSLGLRVLKETQISQGRMNMIYCRTYPFFYFD